VRIVIATKEAIRKNKLKVENKNYGIKSKLKQIENENYGIKSN
jgi:hypothetical protein